MEPFLLPARVTRLLVLICVHIVATDVVLDELFGLKLSRISFSAYIVKIV